MDINYRKPGCCKPNIMDNATGHSKEQNDYREGNSEDGVQEITGGNEKYLGDQIEDLGYHVPKELGYIWSIS